MLSGTNLLSKNSNTLPKNRDSDFVSLLSPEEANVIGRHHYSFVICHDFEEEALHRYSLTLIAPNSPQLHPDQILIQKNCLANIAVHMINLNSTELPLVE